MDAEPLPDSRNILTVTNLFPFPDDETRGVFNLQQFLGLPGRFDHTVLVPVPWRQWSRSFSNVQSYRGIRTRYFPFFYPPIIARASHGWWLWQSLRAALSGEWKQWKPDCVVGSFLFPDGYAAMKLSEHFGVPLVLKAHGSDLNVKAVDPIQGPVISELLPRAFSLVVVSQALAVQAVKLGVEPARVRLVTNGVDTDLFRVMDHELARRESGWSTDRHVVLYVGNLKESKGCLDLLNAVARSPQHATTVELIFVGDGESRHALEKAAVSLGVSDTVRFMGKQPHDRLWQFMNAADVLVLPSHAEGIPNVLLEAMACGCPVVASNVGGIPEIVEPVSGVLVPPNSPEQLLAALVEVLRRPRNSVQIRATMLNRSWTRSGESLAAVLDEAISSCRVSAAGIPIDIRGAR